MSLRRAYLWFSFFLLPTIVFSAEYFQNPYTAVSEFLYPEETQIMPTGALRTHCGILHFSLSPVETRLPEREIKLLDDWLPVVWWEVSYGGIKYRWQIFATTNLRTRRLYYKASTINLFDKFEIIKMPNLFNFIFIEAENLTTAVQSARLFMHYEIGKGIPMMVDYLSKEYIYFDHRGRSFTLQDQGEWFGDRRELLIFFKPFAGFRDDKLYLGSELLPQQKTNWLIILPYFPAHPADRKELRGAKLDRLLEKKLTFYHQLRQEIPELRLGEEKPQKLFYASLMYLLETCLDKIRHRYILRANPFQYDQFYIRDSAFMVRAFDMVGLFDLAERCLEFFLESQEKCGRFASQPAQYDANGLALYAIGQHLELSRNQKWAKRSFKKVHLSMKWLYEYRELREGKKWLLPISTMHDNEQVKDAHIVGHNLWGLAGMQKACLIAKQAGELQTAQLWGQWFEQYKGVIIEELQRTAVINGGFISPAFEGKNTPGNVPGRFQLYYGFDWGNLQLLYPISLLSNSDAIVQGSVNYWKQFLREGLFPYPEGGNENFLHHYLSLDLMHQQLVAGRTNELLNEFYSGILFHTTAANAGCERLDCSRRDFQPPENLTPHGTFAAKYIEFLRNSLVREVEDELHLTSFLSPRWTQPGNQLKLLRAPTVFGNISFIFSFAQERGHLQLTPPRSSQLKKIIVHLPPWLKVTGAAADGKFLKISSPQNLVLPPSVRSVDIQWERLAEPQIHSSN